MRLNIFKIAFFHLITHAIFKSILFLCAGFLIHQITGVQDIRLLSRISYFCPSILIRIIAANLALCGFPFFSGFYSKDLILEFLFSNNTNIFRLLILFVSCILTITYRIRLIIFLTIKSHIKLSINNLLHSDIWITLPTIILSFFSLIIGSSLIWILFFRNKLVRNLFLEKIIIFRIIFLSFFFAHKIKKINTVKTLYFIYLLWFLSYLSSQWILYNNIFIIQTIKKIGESGWNEILGGQGIFLLNKKISIYSELYQSTNFKIYLINFSLLFFLTIFYLFSNSL